MPALKKIDSNNTGLSYAIEDSPGVLPVTPVWLELEPNSYPDFGASLTTVARDPIAQGRQNKKGSVVDLDATGGFNTDMTLSNMQDLLQGFFFADLRRKSEAQNGSGLTTLSIAAANTNSRLTVSGTPSLDFTDLFPVGTLVFVKGFSASGNNGLFVVSANATDSIDLDDADGSGTAATITDESANSGASIVAVGFETAAGDLDVDASGARPAITSTTLDLTTLGLTVGEWVWLGGDDADTRFATAGNSTRARVRSIAASRVEFDKTGKTMVTEANAALNVHIYTGRVIKNEVGTLVKTRTVQLERSLGVPNTDNPSEVQGEYLLGAYSNTMTFNIQNASKMTVDLGFVCTEPEVRAAADGLKSGTRVPAVEAELLNTSSDIKRIKLGPVDDTTPTPTALFSEVTDLTIEINNGVTPEKAIGTLGAFDASIGNFVVSGNLEAYFETVQAVASVQANASTTMDVHFWKSNAGIAIDIPLITLGDARANVEKNRAIRLPITQEAASGAFIDPALNHTMLMVFYDYLPDAANVRE